MDLKSFALGSVVRERWAPLEYTYVDTNYWYIKNNVLHLFPSEIPADADASGTVDLNIRPPTTTHVTMPWDAYKGSVTKVVADNSNIGLKSMHCWFEGFTALTDISRLSNLDTRNVDAFFWAFSGCTALTDVTIFLGKSRPVPNPRSQVYYTMMWGMFQSCSNIIRVKLCDQIKRIDTQMFSFCTSLPSISIPNSVEEIGDAAFWSCNMLASVTIPNSVTRIEGRAFDGCSSMESITIPNSVTSIGASAFESSGLKTISLPNSITEIADRLFYSCRHLQTLTVPGSVTAVGSSAFEYCDSITEFHFLSETPPSLGSSAFAFIFLPSHPPCTIYVPMASLSAYQTASDWEFYASYMVGE